MAKYFTQHIKNTEAPIKPLLGPYAGLKLAKQSRVVAAMRAQDAVPAIGRRVVAAQTLGTQNWLTPSGEQADSVTQTHPYMNHVRPVMHGRCDLTPGCFLELVCHYAPPGGVSFLLTDPVEYRHAGFFGYLQINVTFEARSGSDETKTFILNLGPGGPDPDIWSTSKVAILPYIEPDDLFTGSEASRWTQHSGVRYTISHVGGCRILDCVLYEVPRRVTREADDDGSYWTSHMFGSPDIDGANHPAMNHPWQRWSETTPDGDPRGGTWHMSDVAEAQALRLGPDLISWTPYYDENAGITDTTMTPFSTTSTSFVSMPAGRSATYDADEPGWSLSTGAYARRYDECHPYWSAENGTIPVYVHVYGYGASSETGVVRVQASDYSWIDVAIATGSVNAWNTAYGHLRCGIGPGDPSVVQAFCLSDGGGTVNIAGLKVQYGGQWTSAIT